MRNLSQRDGEMVRGGGIIKKAREKKGKVITKCTRIGLEKEKA